MKNKWAKLFGNKKFKYYLNTINLKKNNNNFLHTFNKAKIIYPELNKTKFSKILKFIEKNIKLKKKSSLLDFGSGNGCFINYFIIKFNLQNNMSFEVSNSLLNLQKREVKFTRFFKTDDKEFNFNNPKKFKVTTSICLSCFQYFQSYFYAKKVLHFLLDITENTVFIYDIKDYGKKSEYRNNVRLRQKLTKSDFLKKYQSYPLRYYKKKFFVEILSKKKYKNKFKYKFVNLPSSSTDNKYGYCLVITKK